MLSRSHCLGTIGYLGGLMTLPELFCWSWGQMLAFNAEHLLQPGESIHYTRARMSLHQTARNWLVQERRGDWLLMLDTDHTFPPDLCLTMLTLMKRYQTPVLTGIYRHKTLPHHPMLWAWQTGQDGLVPIAEYDPTIPCFQVDAAGGGCLMIHGSVLEKCARELPEEEPFTHRGKYGEDFSFFHRCKQLGIPVFATPLAETTHLTLKPITAEDYIEDWWGATEEVPLGVPAIRET
jgi:hypothetical protein